MAESARTPEGPGERHLRLVAFFVALAVLGGGGGTLYLRTLAGKGASRVDLDVAAIVLIVTVVAVCLAGFVGVFLHRLYVLPMKQREIERYLLRIERESAKQRALLAGAVDMLVLVDPASGEVRECNAAASDELGLVAAEERRDPPVAASRMSEFLKPGARELVLEAIARATAEPGEPVDVPELVVRGADGRSFPVAARVVAIRVGEESIVELALRDLSEQRELEQRLRLHERLGSLGLLTASVAHEINNPLEGIGNYLALLGRPTLQPEQRERYLEQVAHGFGLIRDIVRDLLRFARPGVAGGEADLRQVCEGAVRLAAYAEACKRVRFVLDAPEHGPLVFGDAARLEQLVLNLLLNAGKAMRGEGQVTIRVRERVGDEGEREVLVSDEGPGIAEEDLERLFDPFFTTGDGTGLGLSIAYGIVRAHGGTIVARNRAEGGAEFGVRFPAPREQAGHPTR